MNDSGATKSIIINFHHTFYFTLLRLKMSHRHGSYISGTLICFFIHSSTDIYRVLETCGHKDKKKTQ